MRQIEDNVPHLEMRLFSCDNGKTYVVQGNGCLFCDHCTDVFYDFTHGPYMEICGLGLNTQEGMAGKCRIFSEGNEQ